MKLNGKIPNRKVTFNAPAAGRNTLAANGRSILSEPLARRHLFQGLVFNQGFDDLRKVLLGLADMKAAGAGPRMSPALETGEQHSDVHLASAVEYAVPHVDRNFIDILGVVADANVCESLGEKRINQKSVSGRRFAEGSEVGDGPAPARGCAPLNACGRSCSPRLFCRSAAAPRNPTGRNEYPNPAITPPDDSNRAHPVHPGSILSSRATRSRIFPAEALRLGTSRPSRFYGRSDQFATIFRKSIRIEVIDDAGGRGGLAKFSFERFIDSVSEVVVKPHRTAIIIG